MKLKNRFGLGKSPDKSLAAYALVLDAILYRVGRWSDCKKRAKAVRGIMHSSEIATIAADRARIAVQEGHLVFPHFDYATAWSLGTTLRRLAVERSLSVVIDIRKFGDPFQLLFHTALPGTNPDNLRWVERKAKIVSRFHRSSYSAGLYLQEKGATFTEKYSLPDAEYATHGGAFPIAVSGAGIIGAVTVSGLPMRADHELAVEGICLELHLSYADVRLP